MSTKVDLTGARRTFYGTQLGCEPQCLTRDWDCGQSRLSSHFPLCLGTPAAHLCKRRKGGQPQPVWQENHGPKGVLTPRRVGTFGRRRYHGQNSQSVG